MRALNGEDITGRTQADIQRLDGAVGDAAAHTQAIDRRGSQDAGVGGVVACIVCVKGVGSAFSVDIKAGPYSIQGSACRRGRSPNIDRIVVCTGIDGGLGVDGPDVDDIVARDGRDRRFARYVADVDGVVLVPAVHRHVVRDDRAEQVDDRARRVDGAVVAADDDVTERGDERAGLQVEVAPGEQFDIAAGR